MNEFDVKIITEILRLPAVLQKRGRSRASHYGDIKEGLFTKPVLIGLRSVGWPANELAILNGARVAGATENEIRMIVKSLEAARKSNKRGGTNV